MTSFAAVSPWDAIMAYRTWTPLQAASIVTHGATVVLGTAWMVAWALDANVDAHCTAADDHPVVCDGVARLPLIQEPFNAQTLWRWLLAPTYTIYACLLLAKPRLAFRQLYGSTIDGEAVSRLMGGSALPSAGYVLSVAHSTALRPFAPLHVGFIAYVVAQSAIHAWGTTLPRWHAGVLHLVYTFSTPVLLLLLVRTAG